MKKILVAVVILIVLFYYFLINSANRSLTIVQHQNTPTPQTFTPVYPHTNGKE